ncbi:hypothetical protein Nepgr_000923 [Nepenthes gracilis]|uniref:SAWADEE domain-containing protein n=1 Tax=Nepenthes gracilis TaxID=150966 RepID=A0AAD3P3M3_NEPGR|nr:hypothetical protein Nepgr_000923 [Nepenthes gracilis]
MDRLRPRDRKVFSGFTTAEFEKLEKLLYEFGEQTLSREFCQKVAIAFSRSAGRAGKPRVKWDEIQGWFQNKQKECLVKSNSLSLQLMEITTLPDVAGNLVVRPDACIPKHSHEQCEILINLPSTQLMETTCLPGVRKTLVACPDAYIPKKAHEVNRVPKGAKFAYLSDFEVEARSSRDGAWYDVDRIITHRVVSSGEVEVRVRFSGYGAKDDEWVNAKRSVRERSIPLEHWECYKVKVRDVVLCFQEKKDQALYYDAHVVGILRRMHDIRGCRCIFLVRYDHDRTEASSKLDICCSSPVVACASLYN